MPGSQVVHPGEASGAGAALTTADPETAAGSPSPSEDPGDANPDSILDDALDGVSTPGETHEDPPEEAADEAAEPEPEPLPEEEVTNEELAETEDEDKLDDTPEEKPKEKAADEEAPIGFSKYKDVFKAHPELRDVLGNARAVKEAFGSTKEALEIGKLVPTKADAEILHAAASELDGWNQALDSGDTEAVHERISGMVKADPERYAMLAAAVLSDPNLNKAAPAAFRQFTFDRYVSVTRNLLAAARAEGDEDKADRYAATLKDLEASSASPQAAETPRERELREKLEAREKADNEANANRRQGFFTPLGESTRTAISDLVSKQVALYGDRSPAEKALLIREATDKIFKTVDTDANVYRRAVEINRKGNYDQAHGKALVDLYLDYGKRLVRSTVSGVVQEFGTAAAKENKKVRTAAVTQARSTREIGGGSRAPGKNPTARPFQRTDSPRDVLDSVLGD